MSINRKNLLNAVESAKKFTMKKGLQPILSNILLISKANKLILKSTDLYTFYENTIDQENGAIFETTVSAQNLLAELKAIKSETLELSLINNEFLLTKTDAEEISLSTILASEFPAFSTIDDKKKKIIVEGLDTKTLKKVADAAARFESNNLLTNVNYKSDTNTLAGVDGNRLYTAKLDCDVKTKGAEVMFSANVAKKLTQKKYDLYELNFSKISKGVLIQNGAEKILTKTSEGQYPKYEQLMPHHNNNVLEVDAKVLKQFLTALELTLNPRTSILELRFFKDEVIGYTETPGVGFTSKKLSYKNKDFRGSDISHICLNSRYFKDIAALGNSIKFSFMTELSAVRVDVDNFECLIMPIQRR